MKDKNNKENKSRERESEREREREDRKPQENVNTKISIFPVLFLLSKSFDKLLLCQSLLTFDILSQSWSTFYAESIQSATEPCGAMCSVPDFGTLRLLVQICICLCSECGVKTILAVQHSTCRFLPRNLCVKVTC
jgi:hypothetical protein